MQKKLLNIVKYIILLGVAAALLLYALKGMDVKKVFQQISSANIFWVSVSGFISIVAFVVRAHRWNLLIEPMGYNPSLKNTTYSVLIGYLANLAFPRLGEVSRCGALSKVESIPFNKLLGTVIVERIIDVLCLIICILLAAAIEFKRLGNFFTEKMRILCILSLNPRDQYIYDVFVYLRQHPGLCVKIIMLRGNHDGIYSYRFVVIIIF